MSKIKYSDRLKSKSWIRFSKECRQRVNHKCQMCGRQDGSSVVHHMRYHNLNTRKEWADVVVVCPPCHDTYHSVHRLPPQGAKSREALLTEMSMVLMRKGVDVSFFLNHGDEMERFWMASPIVMDGIQHPLAETKSGKRKKWDPADFDVLPQHAAMLLRNPSLKVNGKVWRARLGIPTPYPRKWKKRLLAHLRKKFPDLKPDANAPLYLADCLDGG